MILLGFDAGLVESRMVDKQIVEASGIGFLILNYERFECMSAMPG